MFHKHNEGVEHMNAASTESLFEYTDKEVAWLLSAYQEYKTLAEQIESGAIVTEKPKFSLFDRLGVMQNLDPLAKAKKKLEKIGESMKFQNPLIWLRYKLEAYKNEPGKEINTVGDLIAHCKVDGICHKRFDAINTYLRGRYEGKDLTDSTFVDPSFSLEDLARDPRYISLCFDLLFQTKWSRHENDTVGKWQGYAFVDEPAERYSCGC